MVCDICEISDVAYYFADDGDEYPHFTNIYSVPSEFAVKTSMPYEGGDIDVCGPCLSRIYEVDDIVLAFYPELADSLNEDEDLAATARSIELPYDDLSCVVIIRQYADYSKVPLRDIIPAKNEGSGLSKPRVKVATIVGRMDESNKEFVKFEIHAGYAPIFDNAIPLINPPSWCDSPDTNKIKWVDLSKVTAPGIQATYRYNLYDEAGLQSLCDWAKKEIRNWLCRWHLTEASEPGFIDLTKI